MSREERIKTIVQTIPQLSEEELSAVESVLQKYLKEDADADKHNDELFEALLERRRTLFEKLAK